MPIRFIAPLCAALFCLVARAADGPALDAAKYPQDTPEKALDSVAKSLEASDLAYWNTYLATPDQLQRMLAKYKTLDAMVAANIDDPKKIAGRKKLVAFLRKMQADKKAPEFLNKEMTATRFNGDHGMFVQFELQPDKRWCFDPQGGAGAPPPPPTAPGTTAAGTK
jgi:hypothetical protein